MRGGARVQPQNRAGLHRGAGTGLQFLLFKLPRFFLGHRGVREGCPCLVEPGSTEQSLDENQQHPVNLRNVK